MLENCATDVNCAQMTNIVWLFIFAFKFTIKCWCYDAGYYYNYSLTHLKGYFDHWYGEFTQTLEYT